MFAPEPAFDLSAYAKRHGMTALEMEILKAYFELGSDVREKLLQHFKERLAKTVAPEAGKAIPVPTTPATSRQDRPEPDASGQDQMEEDFEAQARKQAELYYQQLLSEKERARQAPFAKESGTA